MKGETYRSCLIFRQGAQAKKLHWLKLTNCKQALLHRKYSFTDNEEDERKRNERERDREKRKKDCETILHREWFVKISRKNRLQNLHARAVCFYDSRSLSVDLHAMHSRDTKVKKKKRKKKIL